MHHKNKIPSFHNLNLALLCKVDDSSQTWKFNTGYQFLLWLGDFLYHLGFVAGLQ